MWNPDKNTGVDKSYQWKIVNHGEYFSIQSVRFNEYMYCGKSMLDDKRRHVLTWGNQDDKPVTDKDMRWNIEKL
jgi:hypothetical protein